MWYNKLSKYHPCIPCVNEEWVTPQIFPDICWNQAKKTELCRPYWLPFNQPEVFIKYWEMKISFLSWQKRNCSGEDPLSPDFHFFFFFLALTDVKTLCKFCSPLKISMSFTYSWFKLTCSRITIWLICLFSYSQNYQTNHLVPFNLTSLKAMLQIQPSGAFNLKDSYMQRKLPVL